MLILKDSIVTFETDNDYSSNERCYQDPKEGISTDFGYVSKTAQEFKRKKLPYDYYPYESTQAVIIGMVIVYM